jgi:ComF family protein
VVLPSFIRDVVDFVYPGRCAACAADCDGFALVCHSCASKLDHLASQPACAKCASPVVSKGAPCPWCRGTGIYPFKTIVRLGRFDEPLKEIVHAMKYHRRWILAEKMAERLAEEERVAELMRNTDVLVPVPLHWKRHIGRSYNQADVLARALARRFKKRLSRAVRRVRPTPSQTAMNSRTAREENIHNAFAPIRAKGISGKRVALIDDVMTTAATMQAAARAIVPMEPESISALVIAVADQHGRDFESV